METNTKQLAPLIEAQKQDLAKGNRVWHRHYSLLENDTAIDAAIDPPEESLAPEHEAEVDKRAKVEAAKIVCEFVARFVTQLLKARNPRLQLIAWLYASNFPVADILGCEGNTLRDIAKHVGVTHQTLHKIVTNLGKTYQLSYSGQRVHSHD